MISFVTRGNNTERTPTLSDVEENQFFIDFEGYLAVKVTDVSVCYLAKADGTPWAAFFEDFGRDSSIQAILPHVSKIEFS